MLRLQSSLPADRLVTVLGELLARRERATGRIMGRNFTLQPVSGPYSVPVTVRGAIDDAGTGAVITARVAPHWIMVAGFFVWAWIALEYVSAPIWFLALGFVICMVSFEKQKQKAYDFLREASAA